MATATAREHPYHPPIVCYNVENLPPVDKDLLDRLASGSHELVQELTIPARDGRWVLPLHGWLYAWLQMCNPTQQLYYVVLNSRELRLNNVAVHMCMHPCMQSLGSEGWPSVQDRMHRGTASSRRQLLEPAQS